MTSSDVTWRHPDHRTKKKFSSKTFSNHFRKSQGVWLPVFKSFKSYKQRFGGAGLLDPPPAWVGLRGQGGGPGSKFEIFLLLTCLKIWNMGVQELFTELKNIHRRPSNDATNIAPFCVFLAIYRGKWPKNGLKINWRGKILSTGSSNNPHFGFVVSSYDT